jgi:hypothetical protein
VDLVRDKGEMGCEARQEMWPVRATKCVEFVVKNWTSNLVAVQSEAATDDLNPVPKTALYTQQRHPRA